MVRNLRYRRAETSGLVMEGLRKMALGQPAWTAFVVALISRLMLVVGSQVTHRWPLIPDEGLYVELATLAVDGRIDEICCGGYGPELYSSVRLFVWPLYGLVALFGPRTWILQMPAVLFGAVTAFVVSRIAGRFVSARWALFAGLVMALLPSAVLHSSTVLRESLIWLLVAGAAWLVIFWTEDGGLRRLVICSVGLLLVVIGLGWVRDQTAVLAAWSLVPVALFVRNQRRERLCLLVVLLLVGPWVTASGPAGLQLVENSFPKLGTIRAWMSEGAQSAFVTFEQFPSSVPGVSGTSGSVEVGESEIVLGQTDPSSSVPGVSGTSGSVEVGESEIVLGQTDPSSSVPGVSGTSDVEAGASAISQRGTTMVVKDGRSFDIVSHTMLVDNSIVQNLKQVPNGLAAFYFRPFPWEARGEKPLQFRLASIENSLWLFLYGFALFGIRPLWRLHPALLIFAASNFLLTGLVAAVTQGNLGTAFRHRLQILWVVALLTVVGGEYLWARRQAQRLRRVEPGLLS
jgi:hypothetical protein